MKPLTRVQAWLLGTAIWTLFPLLSALQGAFYRFYVDRPIVWRELLPLRLVDWWTCAIFTPLCFWLVRRFPLERDKLARSITVQVLAVSAMVFAKYAIYAPLGRWLAPEGDWALGAILARSFVAESMAFWAVLGIVHALEYHRRYTEREAELAEARLDALAAQIQPHFLFNTLNSVSALMRRDPDGADDMLTHLGTLLHRTLRGSGRHEVALRDELELLEHYLEIMRVRFHDRLTVTIDVPSELADVRVPQFILQPLVENAIQHGISRRAGAGRLEIKASRENEMLEVRVIDDGGGLDDFPREGIGLTNTRRRLAQLYGDRQSLELLPVQGGGLAVALRVPLAPSPAARERADARSASGEGLSHVANGDSPSPGAARHPLPRAGEGR